MLFKWFETIDETIKFDFCDSKADTCAQRSWKLWVAKRARD